MNMLLEIHLLMREGSKTTEIWYAVGQVVAGQECCLPGHGAVTARCWVFFVFFFPISRHAICILTRERLPL